MEFAYPLLGFIFGALVGAAITWFCLVSKLRNATQADNSDRHSVLLLTERVQNRDSDIQKLQFSINAHNEELLRTKQDLTRTMTELAAANERNLRLNDFQLLVDQRGNLTTEP